MKYSLLLCSLLLISCGSPLDEGYWKEHNVEADISDNNEERSFTIEFENLQQNMDMTFSGQSLRRLADKKVRITLTLNYHSSVTGFEFRIRNTACPGPFNGPSTPSADSSKPFNDTFPLNSISDDPNRNLEDQYIYLRGIVPGNVGAIDLACSRIRL